MRSARFCLLTTVALATSAFAGCGGTSDPGDPSSGARAGAGNQAGAGTANGGSGTNTGGTSAGRGGAGGATPAACNEAECGPQLGLPNWTCADGSLGGPTGRCIEQPTGGCGWEVNDCPPAGEGGAPQGGQGPGGAAGEPGAGGATTDACGGCEASQICVQQIGGPGPGGFRCAMQQPCGAPGACACIVGQGTCQPELMGRPPGYCICDNGLD